MRFWLLWMVPLLCGIAWQRGTESYEGADHRCGDYTWEHDLSQWDRLTADMAKVQLTWIWVPLNVPNAPGDLTSGGHHEAWGWYQIEKIPTCRWLRVNQ